MTLMTRTGPAGRWLVLLSVCLAAMTMPLSFTGPAVALSRIAADLGGSPLALNWVTNAFMLTFGAGLMAAGALADNHGRKRIFLAGLAVYLLAALGCMLAPDIVWFDMFRALQGIGGAAAFAGGASALAQEFDGQSRLRAVTESRDPDATGLDCAGAGTFTIALAALTYGVLQAPQSGWAAPFVLALLGVAAVGFAAFVIVERRVRRPMLD
ncbi:MAG: MFS transporter, partial [Mesorhizobium sp.]